MARGDLRIYLGAAPGVGKTFAMLDEGFRRHGRGADVVVAFVETHGREQTAAKVRDLEVVPRRRVEYRGSMLEEMDLDAVLARRPQVALVDELAHTNVPGLRHPKRWEDVEDLLVAGIDVVSTVNVQHLESLNDVVQRITGIAQRETVPDDVVRRADQVELVDMTPEALRRRMAHGNVYPAERIDAALANYFRPGNLAALRELALLWVADRVDESLQDYLVAHGITDTWETREKVVVAITGAPGGDLVVRRAARMAARSRAELVGVHVTPADGLARRSGRELDHHRVLVGELGGTYREIVGDDVAAGLAAFARSEKATQLVVGASRRSRWYDLTHGSLLAGLVRRVDQVDVHVIATDPAAGAPGPVLPRLRRTTALPLRRQALGWAAVLVVLPLLARLGVTGRAQFALSSVLLAFLAAVVVIAAVGGIVVGVVAAVAASLLVNWYFTPPLRTFTVGETENVVALVVFVFVAVLVSVLVDRAARRTREALRARAEAQALARTTAALAAPDPLPTILAQIGSVFGADASAVLRRDGAGWVLQAAHGDDPPTAPNPGATVDLDDDRVLVLAGPPLTPDDLAVLRTFADQLAIAMAGQRLQAEAAAGEELSRVDRLRTALLQAVSHDLRTPLASIKASVTSLLQRDVEWSEDDAATFLHAIDSSTDRLDRVVANLLDMSRLQAGALEPLTRPTPLEDVVAAALVNLSGVDGRVTVDVPATLPLVDVDPALLERALANVVSNALAWSPPDRPVRIQAACVGAGIHLRVVDRGPGLPEPARAQMFEPFQRFGDQSHDAGAGLGLAVARGFVDALGGTLEADDTPGGGLTMTIALPRAAP